MRRPPRAPYSLLEVLRLLAVVFCAGLGYEVGGLLDPGARLVGPFGGLAAGVALGSAVGYVLGGVLGRTALSAADRAGVALRHVDAETLVAAVLGGLAGTIGAAALAWPLLLLPAVVLGAPLFGFVVVVVGYLGATLGRGRQDALLRLLGHRVGLERRVVPAAALPRLVDTSVAIDGRVLDVVRAGFLHGTMLVPTPVLDELRGLADAGDTLRRARGRRGLDVLEALRREPGVVVEVLADDVPAVPDVDAKLVRLALDTPAALLTLDTNLARAARLAGVRVLNLHALTLALRPPVLAGEDIEVHLLKPGKEPGQAVGYLDDGSMVVVERARARLGADVVVHVTSVLTTANGRMVFARLEDDGRVPTPARPTPGVPLPAPPPRAPDGAARAVPAPSSARRSQ